MSLFVQVNGRTIGKYQNSKREKKVNFSINENKNNNEKKKITIYTNMFKQIINFGAHKQAENWFAPFIFATIENVENTRCETDRATNRRKQKK